MTDVLKPTPEKEAAIAAHDSMAGQYAADLIYFVKDGNLAIGETTFLGEAIDGTPFWKTELTRTRKDPQSGEVLVDSMTATSLQILRTTLWIVQGSWRTDEKFTKVANAVQGMLQAAAGKTPSTFDA